MIVLLVNNKYSATAEESTILCHGVKEHPPSLEKAKKTSISNIFY